MSLNKIWTKRTKSREQGLEAWEDESFGIEGGRNRVEGEMGDRRE